MKKQQQSSLATSNNICPKQKIDVISNTKKLIDKLERGKLSANLMRKFIIDQNSLINDKVEDRLKAFDHHSMVVLETFVNCLSLLKSSSHQYKFQEFGDQGFSTKSVKSRRGCYKRRKIGDSRQEEVEYLIDDGFAWRKYGQKFIFNSIYPRHYYRCTHSHDQKCKATKQVQQISDNPTKFKLMYHGNHSCITNILNSSPKQDSSAVVLSFDQSNQVNPSLFTTSPSIMSNDSYRLVVSPLSSVNCSVPDEMKATSSGVSSNPVSKQTEEVSAENNSYTSIFDYLDEDCNFIMDDFSQLLPDWWTS